ncbi:uncharacterized protein BO87DRAFT_453278 [Aspergillus neoniger CBS 115656]|uniref:Uncharacterized protein n=1 Tax=Aspergillus neoniger (strain CBS 115656) TaxID=1448310 RepID=A0A318YQW7_ASPNB|nr:hypothetical protein BO87DRAFT_453278 [Aspergillus neoniger CBS 115656]PYH36307.1 hypothetical protein BO87DRAFT_453278 [Aspergillus neoniger CBS 115656]
MLGSWGLSPRSTSRWAAAAAAASFLLVSHVAPPATALYVSEGSPCWDVCNDPTNTTTSEIVCMDAAYNDTTTGKNFKDCVSCALNSTYTDPSGLVTDVDWGLYNLRYAFSACVYGYPAGVDSVSSQCLVSCQGLDSAIEFDLLTPNDINLRAWCSTSTFADNQIETCEFCYNLTETQVLMANFIEALRYDCHFPVPSQTAFPISPSLIFAQEQLPTYSSDLLDTPSGGGVNYKLATLIGLPLMGFVILLFILTIGCVLGISWWRRQEREDEELRQWKAMAAENPWSEYPPPEMYSQPQQITQYGSGFQVVDTDGRTHEVGYSKQVMMNVSEDKGKSPSQEYPGELKL